MKTKIIVIVGPTAVGKTALSIEVAKRFDGQIISGDSQQVYRGLDIGTAKIRSEEQEGISHHLLDVREVGESYSAYDFVTEAAQAIREIAAQDQLPIICGGTGLYIKRLKIFYVTIVCLAISFISLSSNPAFDLFFVLELLIFLLLSNYIFSSHGIQPLKKERAFKV